MKDYESCSSQENLAFDPVFQINTAILLILKFTHFHFMRILLDFSFEFSSSTIYVAINRFFFDGAVNLGLIYNIIESVI